MALDPETFAILKDSIERFVRERLVPAENHLEEHDEVPPAIISEMRQLGLFGISIPEAYGGLGLSLAEEAELVMRLGQTALAFRSAFGTNVGIGSQGILIDGTEQQRREFLPRIASGELIVSFALTEPEAGSDAASLRTSATRDGDHYVLNGTKRYITNAPSAGAFTVMARTEPGVTGSGGISAFIVPASLPGLELGKPDRKMGQRGAKTCDVILDNVRVPAANIIGGVPGQGFKTAMKVLDRGRLHMAALAVGMAKRLLAEARDYALERRQFGSAIAEFQLIQAMLADSQTEIYAGECMVRDATQRYDASRNSDRERGEARDARISILASCAKLFCTEMVGRVADRAVQIHGGAGYIAEYKVERFYRDVRLLRLYEGTSQIQQLIIAKALLRDDP